MRRLIFGLLLMAVACGEPQAQPPASPSALATPSAPTATPPLFAALQAEGTAKASQWNTVAIAGLDGSIKAKTTFAPMRVPNVGCTFAAVLPLSAHVAAGKVYFADASGVVRSLSGSGQITEVAAFPLTSSQQMLSFAVSPDGSRLLAAVFTLPSKPQLGCSGTPGVSGYGLDVYSAEPGGANTLLYHEKLQHVAQTVTYLGISVMALIGWDQVGPIATNPTTWATRGGFPTSFDGTPVRVDPNSGKVLKQVSPVSCIIQDIALSGDFVCGPGDGGLSVRRPDGSEIWHAGNQPFEGRYLSWLSPDEGSLLTAGSVEDVAGAVTSASNSQVTTRDGSRVVLVEGIDPRGWLDPTTVIGINYDSNHLTLVRLSAPGVTVDIGLKGKFLGTLLT